MDKQAELIREIKTNLNICLKDLMNFEEGDYFHFCAGALENCLLAIDLRFTTANELGITKKEIKKLLKMLYLKEIQDFLETCKTDPGFFYAKMRKFTRNCDYINLIKKGIKENFVTWDEINLTPQKLDQMIQTLETDGLKSSVKMAKHIRGSYITMFGFENINIMRLIHQIDLSVKDGTISWKELGTSKKELVYIMFDDIEFWKRNKKQEKRTK